MAVLPLDASDPALVILQVFNSHRRDERLLISGPVADSVIRALVRPLERPAYFLGANVRTVVSAPSRGAFFPRAWARASSKDSEPCGTCPSSALGLRTRILRFLDGLV